MRKIRFIFQEVLKFFLIFLLVFVWIRYFERKLWIATLLSFFISTCVYIVIYFLFRRKKNKESLKIKEKENAENIFLSLACDDKRMEFFEKLALKKHKNVKKYSKYLIVTHDDGTKTLLYPDFEFDKLSIARLMQIYSKIKGKAGKIVTTCHSYDKEIVTFSENLKEKFLILDRFETYQRLYKFYDFFPEIKEEYKKDKLLTFKDFIAYSFNRKRAKGYILSAFLLTLSALFVRTTIYYCIVASLLVIFAIISQFNHIYNPKEDSEIF